MIIAGATRLPSASTARRSANLSSSEGSAALCAPPASLNESVGYIASRIHLAGGALAAVFTREAVTLIHGYLREFHGTINVLADNALVSGFAAQQRPVRTQLVRQGLISISAHRAPATQGAVVRIVWLASGDSFEPVRATRARCGSRRCSASAQIWNQKELERRVRSFLHLSQREVFNESG